MQVLPNLFGAWTLYREWGRIGQSGKVRMGVNSGGVQNSTLSLNRMDTAVQNGGFCHGQKRLIFVPDCWHDEPICDIFACHSEAMSFVDAATCPALT